MNEKEADLAARIYDSLNKYSIYSERGMQAKEFRVGVSDLGYCSERTRRMLGQQVPEDTDMLAAFLGTAIGDHAEKAILQHFDSPVVTQAEVEVTLRGEQRNYTVKGHPDVVLPEDGVVLDGKTSYGLALAERVGADQQKRFQRNLYGVGAFNAGMFGDRPIEEVQVGNFWIDRSGKRKRVHVELQPLDLSVVEEAARWLDDVVYNYANDSEAMKEPPREVCATTCGFFRVCREWQTDVEGLLTDPTIVEAVKMYSESHAMEKLGKEQKAEALAALTDVAGTTGTHTVRWIHVNATEKRAAYSRIEVRELTT